MKADFSNSLISKEDVHAFGKNIPQIEAQLSEKALDMTGWVDLPIKLKDEYLERISCLGKKIRSESSAIVLVGIGGSYLGAKACYDMLNKPFSNETEAVRFYFAGWNMSGTYHKALIKRLDNEDFSVIVVSKSGSTTETKAAFSLLLAKAKEKYSSEYYKRIYVVSEAGSMLHAQSQREGYEFLELDKNVGGRYSVLTSAGLLPIAAMGIDIKKIFSGAEEAYKDCAKGDISSNPCYEYAVIRRLIEKRYSATTEIFCFYEPSMEYFGQWLVQLFGESEGKNNKGLFPSCLILTRDLHSMGQFLQEGTKMFFETTIGVEEPPEDISFETGQPTYNKYNEIIRLSVSQAHKDNPQINFTIGKIDEESFGYLVYFFEKACAVSSLLMGENPFNQPGVEVYKQRVRDLALKFKSVADRLL